MSPWSVENPAFVCYLFYSGVLALKMIIMAPLTGHYRITRKAFANSEDAKLLGGKDIKTDADVERVRRAHQNDVENIPVFFVVGALYLFINPSQFVAMMLFRVFAVSRILHTLLYLNGSSLRPISFLIGIFINIFMAVSLIWNFW